MLGSQGLLVDGPGWPRTLRQMPGYKPIPIRFLLDGGEVLELGTVRPSTPVSWRRWALPDRSWLVVAFLHWGEPTVFRKAQLGAAKPGTGRAPRFDAADWPPPK